MLVEANVAEGAVDVCQWDVATQETSRAINTATNLRLITRKTLLPQMTFVAWEQRALDRLVATCHHSDQHRCFPREVTAAERWGLEVLCHEQAKTLELPREQAHLLNRRRRSLLLQQMHLGMGYIHFHVTCKVLTRY